TLTKYRTLSLIQYWTSSPSRKELLRVLFSFYKNRRTTSFSYFPLKRIKPTAYKLLAQKSYWGKYTELLK
ncbi:unnamed protein product, partial [Allacma fusca]